MKLFHYASPQPFYGLAGRWWPWLAAVATALGLAGLWLGLAVAPTDAQAFAEARAAEMWYQESLRRFLIPERIDRVHPLLQRFQQVPHQQQRTRRRGTGRRPDQGNHLQCRRHETLPCRAEPCPAAFAVVESSHARLPLA